MRKTQLKGFTIIEVVLVLAIAGLIFLMVFLAFPALQKNQRDAQRRQDAGQFISQLQSYRTDNKGRLPTNVDTFVDRYLPDWKDPITQAEYPRDAALNDPGDWTWASGRACDAAVTGAARAFIRMRLETGETCQDL